MNNKHPANQEKTLSFKKNNRSNRKDRHLSKLSQFSSMKLKRSFKILSSFYHHTQGKLLFK